MTERIVTMLDQATIAKRVAELGAQITVDYKDRHLVVIIILKGSFVFAADLTRAIDLPLRVDFLGVRSYGEGTESSGVVQITQDLSRPIADEDVLIVEDIIDSGLTLSWLLRNMRSRGPASVEVCALLRKPDAAKVDVPVKYVGFDIPAEFVVGYGLDYAERYRDLPFVGLLRPEIYAG